MGTERDDLCDAASNSFALPDQITHNPNHELDWNRSSDDLA